MSPLTISFTSAPSGGDGAYSYYWTFGDKSTSTEQNPRHTFEKAGTYEVKVTVTDSGGRTISDATTITVQKPSPLDLANTTGSGPYLLMGIVAIVVVAVALGLLITKKKRSSPPMQPPAQ